MKNRIEGREDSGIVSNIIPSAVAMTILSVLTSCDNDSTITKFNFNEKGKDYKIEINEGVVSVYFAMNANKWKDIRYSISSFKDPKTWQIRVSINGKTRYEDITNTKINKELVYDNEESFQETFLSDASSILNQWFSKLIWAMFPEWIEGLEWGNDRVKGKIENFNELKRRANKLFLYNQKETGDTIISKQWNSIKTKIWDKEIELINSDMLVEWKNGRKAHIYNLLINNEKVGYIPLSKDFDECYATIKKHFFKDNTDAIWYEDEAKLTGIRLAVKNN